jgi:DNA-binding PadR family transcriptional regulator
MLEYKKLLDYIVCMLYVLKQEGKYGYFETKKIIDVFEYPANNNEILEIAKYLEAKGFVNVLYYIGGSSIQITTIGILYIEKDKGDIEIVKNYMSKIHDDSKTKEEITNKTPEQIIKDRQFIYDKLDLIILEINNKLGPKGYDLIKDVEVLKIELYKIMPNMNLIEEKLNILNSIDITRPSCIDLLPLLNF